MESRRQARVARQIQRDLSEIFQEVPTEGRMVGVSKVRISPDLGFARVYLTFINETRPQELIQLIRMQKSQIRGALGQRVRHQLRKVPDLEFYYDDTPEYVDRMEQLFEELRRAEGRDESSEDPSSADPDDTSPNNQPE